LKILYLENHPHFSKIVTSGFLAEYAAVTVVPNISDAKQLLSNETFDVALVDYDLDDGKGVEFVKFVKDLGLQLPIVACSSHENGNNELLAAGANAVCSKLNFKSIVSVIKSII
jgi:DNA-binding response OmpR family regulator